MDTEREIDKLFEKLFPICRSITGNGVRQTLSILQKVTDFDIKEIPSGTKCYDWEVPEEWNIDDAYVENSKHEKIVDFKENNLHVMSYSIPVNKKINYSQLVQHIHTIPEIPDAIPYRTSYYNKNWGFCISDEQLKNISKDDDFHVVIKSTLKPGSLTYGEFLLKGESKQEILISTYCCHPSLGNDNLSGMVLWILLLRYLKEVKRKFTYRFVIIPETIGSITYLSQNESKMKNIFCGLILTCVAGPGKIGYKKSFLGNHILDTTIIETLLELNTDFELYPFDIFGSDERQYSSPFFRIPVGIITKDKFYEYENYHTSKDNLEFINSKYLLETLKIYQKILEKIEFIQPTNVNIDSEKELKKDETCYISLNSYCEPMLSKYGLYPIVGGNNQVDKLNTDDKNSKKKIDPKTLTIIKWILFYSDGKTSIEEISKITKISLEDIQKVIPKLIEKGLLKNMG